MKVLLFRWFLLWFWKYTFFRRCVFNEVLSRFQWKNHVHWWSPRAQNSGNPCAKVIIIVFFVFSVVWHLEKHVKIIKFRSPFGVTHKGFSVIFMKIWRSTYGKSGFPESLWSLYIKHFGGFQGRSHAAAPLIDRIQGCLLRGPWGRPKLRSAILVNWKNVVLRTDRSPRDLARL